MDAGGPLVILRNQQDFPEGRDSFPGLRACPPIQARLKNVRVR
jgi:hypothetical protein